MRKLLTLRLPEDLIEKVKAQEGGYTRFIEDAIRYRLRYFEKLEERSRKRKEEKAKKEIERGGAPSDKEVDDCFRELYGADYKSKDFKN